MGYQGEKDRKRNGGCLKGCGCFSLGFLCGVLILPVIMYTLMTSSWFSRQFNHLIDTNQISQKLREMATEIGEGQQPHISAPLENSGNSQQQMPETSKDKNLNRSLRDKGVYIRFRCTSQAEGSTPFIYGTIENTGSSSVRNLTLETTFYDMEQRPIVESFEVISLGGKYNLGPGKTKEFIIHPQNAPVSWLPETMKLSVKQIQ